MTKQKILDYFKNINEAYNDSSRYDSLSRMLDELLKEHADKELISDAVHETAKQFRRTIVRCKDCKFYCEEHCRNPSLIYWHREPDWFCADGERRCDK